MREEEGEEFKYTSPMETAAISMHEMYQTLKKAGFSRMESLQLVAMMTAHGIAEAIYIQDEEDGEDDD